MTKIVIGIISCAVCLAALLSILYFQVYGTAAGIGPKVPSAAERGVRNTPNGESESPSIFDGIVERFVGDLGQKSGTGDGSSGAESGDGEAEESWIRIRTIKKHPGTDGSDINMDADSAVDAQE